MVHRLKKTASRWAPAVVLMALIYAASATPSADLPSFGLLDTLLKKGGHLAGYFLLALACLRPLVASPKKAPAIALTLVLLFAVSDELHQSFVPGRHPSPLDVAVDMAGAALALAAFRLHAPLSRLVRAGL